ncbi:MAG: hypothetical protein JXR83_02165, partial [Deltaproteobacteria bacterium]|nr:hypothetical protein [Deltaproteobacteria bacterium]
MNRALSVWSVVALLPGAPLFAQPLDEVRFSGRVVARSHLAIRYVAAERWLETIDLSGNDLTAAAWQALARVPAWLRPDLRNTLAVLDDNAQDYYGNLITGVADPLQVDEVAYAVAHSAIEDLELLNGDLLLENAASIYEIAAELSFAELVEHGQPGDDDYHTTVRHAVLVDGVREHYLLPPEIYYRYVVVPVVGFEMLRWLDPSTGRVSVPPTGVFWRDYLYYGGAGDRGYLAPFCLKSPHKIDDAVLAAADFGVARAYGSFIQPESGAVEAIRDAATCAPVAISFVHGDGRCCTGDWPNPDGTIFATLMPLELAAANGSPELLENYLVAGNANARLDLDVSVDTDLATCEFTEQRRRILIVRDRVPFDLATDPNESALAATGFGSDYDVRSSSELPTLALSSTGSPHVNLEYAKIVLVSDQPIDFYRAVAQAAPALESFVDLGGVLEMHLATRRADDWSGLRMPGGVRATAQSEGNRVSAVRAAGYPSLREVLAGASAAWDGRSWPGLAGDRVFDQAESALARIGWWGVRNMPMNFAEIMAWKRCRGLVRSWYPVQIAYNKYGNCGEIADLLDAAARTALIPAVGVGTPLEDHHWGEFFLLDRWHPFQNDWSAAATRIDTWTIAYDADTGGSKSVTEVCSYRGDGLIETVLGRYPPVEVDAAGHIAGDYSRYVTIEVAVSDADGVPVDGALVLVATEAYDDPA